MSISTGMIENFDSTTSARAAARETVITATESIADRLDRVEHVLGDLNGVVMRAGAQLAPILAGGGYSEPPSDLNPASGMMKGSHRSEVAQRLLDLAARADQLADTVTQVRHRLEAVLDATEL